MTSNPRVHAWRSGGGGGGGSGKEAKHLKQYGIVSNAIHL